MYVTIARVQMDHLFTILFLFEMENVCGIGIVQASSTWVSLCYFFASEFYLLLLIVI